MKSTLTVGRIVEALSYYTNPEMTFVNELLSSTVKRFVIPFDEQNYLRYIESLYSAKLNFEGFSEEFKQAIASILGLEPTDISIKAKTKEKLDAVGENKAIEANAVVLLESEE